MKRGTLSIALISIFLSSVHSQTKKTAPPIQVSGIYPHLVMYNTDPAGPVTDHPKPNSALATHEIRGADGKTSLTGKVILRAGESGIGAVVPWAGKLWAVTYPAHQPFGGADKLYELDSQLHITVRPESIGGTHANRMIHAESRQLIIGPYFINEQGAIRSIPYTKMPGRLTGVARHLTDPANKVYFFTMEEGLYEVEVHTLAVTTIHMDGNVSEANIPAGTKGRADLNGYHGKGAYSGQGRVLVSNNGIEDWQTAPNSGVLAEWEPAKGWHTVEKKQFTEITGPGDIYGNSNSTDPIWASGWDERSVVLKLLDNGQWINYRLPKASFTYDGKHGWNTEWPRIRKINDGRWLMTMHGMFWDFPGTFSKVNSAGIKPLSSYLKIIPDFAYWNGQLVFGCDDASAFGNPLVGRPQSNLWFVKPTMLRQFGPRSGFGAVWLNDAVKKDAVSEPFLVNGFDKKLLHLAAVPGLSVTIETDQAGNGNWTTYKTLNTGATGYVYELFPASFNPVWVRLKAGADADKVIAYFQLSQKDARQLAERPTAFTSIPAITDRSNRSLGLIRAAATDDIILQFASYQEDAQGQVKPTGYYEIGGDMQLRPVQNDTMVSWLNDNIGIKQADFSVDAASVIFTDEKGVRYRLPKGNAAYDSRINKNILRGIREVATERSLLNCHGSFYELPREYSGGIACIKPIATHNRFISDFTSWRGLMVIAGNLAGAANNGHYFKSTDGKTGLWFGTIDDLWQLGKPSGNGGPWLNTAVTAQTDSDPYLMTGYDKKSMTISHKAASPVTFTVEVDLTASGDWQPFKQFTVQPGKPINYQFPDGYMAHWLRVKTDKDCTASVQLSYR
ncbi:MAG: hypothetical protein P0Y53_16910 [Candidatus Pseudobacter hemicellulosilyticus]|uniref:Uncharacterized protein n=1 Tax=Candidatus Pseudobacter hemicellulosilyticus TaxID=3121375 RepID=A0AAJ5WTG9_9BACT|nr:MAG: hypothetical protein P0Y53_16910 [Pseudobacter sp.]